MSSKSSLVLSAIFLVLLGIFCIIKPLEFLESIAWIVGLVILAVGGLRMYLAVKSQRYAGIRNTRIVSSSVIVIAGLFIMLSPLFTVQILTIIASLYVLVEGFVLLVQSLNYRKAGFRLWYVIALLGGLIAALGCVGTIWPDKLASAGGVTVGISFVLNGVAYLVALAGFNNLTRFDEAEEVKD